MSQRNKCSLMEKKETQNTIDDIGHRLSLILSYNNCVYCMLSLCLYTYLLRYLTVYECIISMLWQHTVFQVNGTSIKLYWIQRTRERENERDTHTHTQRQTDRDITMDRGRETEIDKQTDRARDTDRDRQTNRPRKRPKQADGLWERDRTSKSSHRSSPLKGEIQPRAFHSLIAD